ncbi:TPA: cobalt ECF transporter T component CbiQ [bacterium]|nr:cobalt ECF transporter T component CbiQ [bacterium]
MKHDFIDSHSDINSVIHRLDPRAKAILIIAMVISIVLTNPKALISFALYGFLILILIFLSKIPISYILKRFIMVMPFILLIAIFLPFIKDGEALWSHSIFGFDLKITYEGLIIFWNVLIKALLSMLCMTLLIASTKFTHLLKALGDLKLPKIFIMIFSFMYRYIFVLQDELEKLKRAKDSRSAGKRRWLNIKALSNMLGVLFIKSYEKGETVYLAMCSRGFDGNVKLLEYNKLAFSDIIFIVVILMFLVFINVFGRF